MTQNDDNKLNFTPVVTKSASEAIYDQIKEKIISGELKTGDKLPSERDLATLLQRSRPTIRETLKRLEHEGLIEVKQGSGGAVVTTPSAKLVQEQIENMIALNVISFEELVEFRTVFDPECAAKAAVRRTDEDLESMQTIIDTELAICSQSPIDYASFQSSDIDFHKALAESTHNRVQVLVNNVIGRFVYDQLSLMYEHNGEEQLSRHLQSISTDHSAIFNAVKERDETLARELMLEHIKRAVI
jgi:GntR family transcriptional repressor for pyruvate dehydrogenase complex